MNTFCWPGGYLGAHRVGALQGDEGDWSEGKAGIFSRDSVLSLIQDWTALCHAEYYL